MKITAGPMITRYATVFDIPVDEVVAWIQGYVNDPKTNFTDQTVEPTERERFASIKGYIERRLSGSTDGRIRSSIAAEQLLEAA